MRPRRQEREVEAQGGTKRKDRKQREKESVEGKEDDANSTHEENNVSKRHITWWLKTGGSVETMDHTCGRLTHKDDTVMMDGETLHDNYRHDASNEHLVDGISRSDSMQNVDIPEFQTYLVLDLGIHSVLSCHSPISCAEEIRRGRKRHDCF